MAEILLATLNAKYIHSAFGLRYLRANLGDLRPRSQIVEFDLSPRPVEVVEALLDLRPSVLGLGVYVWNVAPLTQVVALLKRVRPGLPVILGGPEVSHEIEAQPICQLADHVIAGEADLAFARVCRGILEGTPPPAKILSGEPPDLSRLALPYDEYTDDDVAHRLIYVEASRGCPFTCEFCLSSLDPGVRAFPIDPFLLALERLIERGVRQFKFVDRTFNVDLGTAERILEFFHQRLRPGLFLHFEMIPDRFPDSLRQWAQRFPPGTLQFEVGVQTFNPDVARRIQRRQDRERTAGNLEFLRRQTGVHLHADLIAGLPGESLDSFAAGFDQLVRLGPQEIQVGILKRLRGTSISRHDVEWHMVYNPEPPYEILQNKLLDFATLQQLRRFARYWDLVVNSGNFVQTAPVLWQGFASPFAAFQQWTTWLYQKTGRTHSIALSRLAGFLHEYLTQVLRCDTAQVEETLRADFTRTGRSLSLFCPGDGEPTPRKSRPGQTMKRQVRHLARVGSMGTRGARERYPVHEA